MTAKKPGSAPYSMLIIEHGTTLLTYNNVMLYSILITTLPKLHFKQTDDLKMKYKNIY